MTILHGVQLTSGALAPLVRLCDPVLQSGFCLAGLAIDTWRDNMTIAILALALRLLLFKCYPMPSSVAFHAAGAKPTLGRDNGGTIATFLARCPGGYGGHDGCDGLGGGSPVCLYSLFTGISGQGGSLFWGAHDQCLGHAEGVGLIYVHWAILVVYAVADTVFISISFLERRLNQSFPRWQQVMILNI